MLVVACNWALSDGSLAPGRGRRAGGWLAAIRQAAVRAGAGRDGRYRPVADVTLVFAGDTFDWLVTDLWAGRDRPWHGGRRGREARGRVAAAAAAAARPGLRILRGWIRRGMPLPAADRRGRPAAVATAARVSGVILAGDRDRWLTEFAAGAWGGIGIGDEWSDGVVSVRHGHDLDPLTHVAADAGSAADRPPTLAESLAVDLLVPFAVSARGDPLLWPLVRPAVAGLAAARPSALPARVAALIRVAAAEDRIRDGLVSLWRRHVAGWQAAARRDVPGCEAEFDAIDAVAAWLDRLAADPVPPAAVRRLDLARSSPASGAVVVGHAAADEPSVSWRLAGREESLALEPRSGPPVVAFVGGTPAGRAFVDAA